MDSGVSPRTDLLQDLHRGLPRAAFSLQHVAGAIEVPAEGRATRLGQGPEVLERLPDQDSLLCERSNPSRNTGSGPSCVLAKRSGLLFPKRVNALADLSPSKREL